MKRLAILFLLAAITGSGTRVAAVDFALPLPTGIAPTTPQVPVPVIVDGLPASHGGDWSRTSFRDRLGIAPTDVAIREAKPAGPRVWSRVASWMPFRCGEPHDPLFAKTKWCEQCAPAVRHPLPPLPAGLSTSRACTTGSCAGPTCAPAKASGSCCQKVKDWLCFKYEPLRMPLIPTQKDAALYAYIPTQERGGISATVANCGAGKLGRGVGGSCVPCPATGESILPGYRLANPENVGAPVGPIVSTSYKSPVNR